MLQFRKQPQEVQNVTWCGYLDSLGIRKEWPIIANEAGGSAAQETESALVSLQSEKKCVDPSAPG